MTLLDRMRAVTMARDYCRLAGGDPDEVVAGYITDASGRTHRVRKERWRWYSDVARPPEPAAAVDDPEGAA